MTQSLPRTLLVTNDFPPRQGGIQSYLHGLVSRLPAESVVVYASRHPGWEEFDRAQPFPVIREDTTMLLPTRAVARRAREILRSEGCTTAWFGASAPLGLMAPGLRQAGATWIVACTHGHEIGWGLLPGPRALLRRITGSVDAITYLGEYTHARLARQIGPEAAAKMHYLPPGVDTDFFHPGAHGAAVRDRYRLGERRVVLCVSRIVRRKGQAQLIRALPGIRREVPDAALLLVGDGPDRGHCEELARQLGLSEHVIFTGGVPHVELPAHYAAGDVFAMPCVTRWAGMDVEGLGVVYLEASASGRPVVAGRSGGAPEAVLDGRTGYLVDGTSVSDLQSRVTELLADPGKAAEMGAAGRAWVGEEWTWERQVSRLVDLLAGRARDAPPHLPSE